MPSHWLRITFSISDKEANTLKSLLIVSHPSSLVTLWHTGFSPGSTAGNRVFGCLTQLLAHAPFGDAKKMRFDAPVPSVLSCMALCP